MVKKKQQENSPKSSPINRKSATEKRKRRASKKIEEQQIEDSTSIQVIESPKSSPPKLKRKSIPSNRTKKQQTEDSTAIQVGKDKRKPYRSGFHAISEFVNKFFEKDEEKRQKNPNKFWFTVLQLEKQKESPFWPILEFFFFEQQKEKTTKTEKRKDEWSKSIESILKIVRLFCHDKTTTNCFMFTTSKKEKQVAVESRPEELSLILGLEMVTSEPAEGEDVKTDAEKIFGSVINRLKMENSGQLKKLEVEQAILDIMREKPKAKNQIQRNAEDLVKLFGLYLCITVFFTQANGSMISKNQFAHYFESLDRMKRTCWPIHIHNYLMKSIRKHIHTPLSVSGCVIYLLYWFAEHNNSMTPCNKESMPRMVRWIVCDISTTIESNLNDAMKKMEPEWIEGYLDQEKIILEEYQKKREANSSETLKQNLRISEMQKEKLHEELTELQIKHKKLVTFIDKQSRYVHELNIKDLPDAEVNGQCIDTLSRIFKFTKELQREYDDDEEKDEEIDEQKYIEGEHEEDEDNNDGEHEDKADELNEWNDNESEKTIINSSTPLSNTNQNPEDQEDQMHNDNQDVMNTTETVDESFDYALITLAEAILQLNPEAMFPIEETMLLLTQGEDLENASEIAKQKLDDILENLSESVFVKLEKGCYKMAPELKQKVATIITECPTWSFGLSQDDPTEDSSQTSLSNKDVQQQIIAEALQFIQEHQSDFFSNQENEEDKSEKTPKKKRARKMLGGETLKRKAASKLSRTAVAKRVSDRKEDPDSTKIKTVSGKKILTSQVWLTPINRKMGSE